MYRHLRLFAIKGLKACTLEDLGKVNVICGKNNSGKSTVLEAVQDPKSSAQGIRIGPEEIAKLTSLSLRGKGWADNTSLDRRFGAILAEVVNSREIWYSNEGSSFGSEVGARRSSSPDLARWNFNDKQPDEAFKSLFPVRPQVVLVPPKRHLELTKMIQSQDQVQADGVGILNQLFLSRNQPEGSTQKALFDTIRSEFLSISGGYMLDVFMDASNQASLHFSLSL